MQRNEQLQRLASKVAASWTARASALDARDVFAEFVELRPALAENVDEGLRREVRNGEAAIRDYLTTLVEDPAVAAEIGLINDAVPADELTGRVMAVAAKIAAKSTATVAYGKPAFYQQAEMTLADAYQHAAAVMVENMLARDAEEGIAAFIEKRAPVWSDS